MDTVFSGLSLITYRYRRRRRSANAPNRPAIDYRAHFKSVLSLVRRVFHVTKSPDTLALFSDSSTALPLLFIIGLGLNLQILQHK